MGRLQRISFGRTCVIVGTLLCAYATGFIMQNVLTTSEMAAHTRVEKPLELENVVQMSAAPAANVKVWYAGRMLDFPVMSAVQKDFTSVDLPTETNSPSFTDQSLQVIAPSIEW